MINKKFFLSKWQRYCHREGDYDAKINIPADDTDSGSRSRKQKEDISMASIALKSQQAALKGAGKQTVRKFAAYQLLEDIPKSRAFYRVNAIRRLTGSHGVLPVRPKIDNVRVRRNFNKLL